MNRIGFSQRLELRQSQALVMTPQLQQAIKMLQLSNVELAEFVDSEIEQNPLLVAGVGLVVGGLIASVIPRSSVESSVAGATNKAVKRYARSAAAQGLDVARNAASEMYDEATRQAQSEGLDPEALDQTARDLGQRLRRVAETAVTTAFEPAQDNHQSGPQGDTHHG